MRVIDLKKNILHSSQSRQQSLFFSSIANYEIIKNLSPKLLKTLYFYSLSEGKEVHSDILYLLSMIEDNGNKINDYLNDQILERIYKKSNQVRREIHRLKGLLRFREVSGGYLYGQIKPDFNIIKPLSFHFANRMRNEKIVIHDIKRNLATFCCNGKVFIANIEDKIPDYTEEERIFSQLWLKYFNNIAVAERENKRLQRQKVPIKYRETVIEFLDARIK